jgi:signal transduction histidine kinase
MIEVRDAVTGEIIAAEDQPFIRATRGESTVRDLRVRQVQTGNTLVVRCSAAPLRRGGEVVGAVAVTTDVTGQKKAIADSAEALAVRDRVMGTLGHELRDPLSTLRAAAGVLLRQDALPHGMLRTAQRIDDAAARMAQLIDNLLDFAQTRFLGAMSISATESDITSVCARVVQELELGYPQHAIRLSSTGDTHGRWDPGRIAQIVSNLVVNAIRYGDDAQPIHVNIDGGSSSVLLEVHNWGPAVPPTVLPTIFEPFRRGPAVGGAPSRGLGLGLYIVEQIVRAHGGAIRVRSSEDQGTTFSVNLPRSASVVP